MKSMKTYTEIPSLLSKAFLGTLSEEEERALQQWRDERLMLRICNFFYNAAAFVMEQWIYFNRHFFFFRQPQEMS